MADNNSQLRSSIQAALVAFQNKPLSDASINLLGALGYTSDKVAEFASKPAEFIKDIEEATSATTPIQRDKILLDKWKECAFLFQLTNDEIPSLATAASDGSFCIGCAERQTYHTGRRCRAV